MNAQHGEVFGVGEREEVGLPLKQKPPSNIITMWALSPGCRPGHLWALYFRGWRRQAEGPPAWQSPVSDRLFHSKVCTGRTEQMLFYDPKPFSTPILEKINRRGGQPLPNPPQGAWSVCQARREEKRERRAFMTPDLHGSNLPLGSVLKGYSTQSTFPSIRSVLMLTS